ncbi:replication initiation factor family protein, partial [Vibrio splendidus]
MDSNSPKRHFACSDCGQVYTSIFNAVCPFCRSGVVNQVEVDSKEVHARESYIHEQKPNNYRHKVGQLYPEYADNSGLQVDVESEYENTSTTIDWLAFTVKVADFRHCSKSNPFSCGSFPQMPS